MRYFLLFSLFLLSFATSAHDNASEQLKCETRVSNSPYEIKEAEFNAIMRAEDENRETIKLIENEISSSHLSDSEKSALLDELQKLSQTCGDRLTAVLDHQPTTSNGIYKELKAAQQGLQAEYVNFKARFQNQAAKAAKEVAGQARMKKMESARTIQELEGDPMLITADRVYVVSKDTSAKLKTVTFNKDVIAYLQEDPKGVDFLLAIDKGIVAPEGETGVKRVEGPLYSVKIIGPSQNDRVLGCYDNGALRLLKAITRHGGDKIGAQKYAYLCKK